MDLLKKLSFLSSSGFLQTNQSVHSHSMTGMTAYVRTRYEVYAAYSLYEVSLSL